MKLVASKDNWRLVGATSRSLDPMKPGKDPGVSITEEKVAATITQISPGVYTVKPGAPLTPGEYGIVIRPVDKHKTSPDAGLAGFMGMSRDSNSSATSDLFYSVWDFSVQETKATASNASNPQS